MSGKNQYLILLLSCFILLAGCGRSKNPGLNGPDHETGYYNEQYRPQYHFSPEKGWMNDPNGLVFFEGEYHMFYQYYPDSTVWGPMHWGHAVSSDLIHWQNLPIALYPDSLGYIFSGSAVADKNNTSGLGSADKIPLIAVFTLHDPVAERAGSNKVESQGMAYSLDRGRTWTKYAHNPVLKNPGIRDFRDPKVFWHDGTGKWLMILAVHDRVYLYSSPDLKKWTFESEFGGNAGAHGGVWECPDLFPMKVAGTLITKWVMLVSINPGGPNGGSATQYFTGDFNGHEFIPDEISVKWIDYGPDNYAGVTWSCVPESDGRRLFIGWMNNWNYANRIPAGKWRGAMTIPRELRLKNDPGGFVLESKPVHELDTLHIASESTGFKLEGTSKVQEIFDKKLNLGKCELAFDFNFGDSFPDTLKLVLGNDKGEKLIIGLSFLKDMVFIDRSASGDTAFHKDFGKIATAPFKPSKTLKMTLFLDETSAELFVNDGKVVMTSLFFPSAEYTRLNFCSKGGSSATGSFRFNELEGIWRPGQ